MEGYFKDVRTGNDLRLKLISEPIDISIYQNGHRLAFFRESLASLLTHQNCKSVLDLELLMSTTKCFPGILSPKVETQIEFTVRKYNPIDDCVHGTATDRRESVGICWNNVVSGDTARHQQSSQQQHGHNHAKLDDEKRSQEARRIKRQKAVCHINNENAANFVPVNVLPKRKASDSSQTSSSAPNSIHEGATRQSVSVHFI